MSRKSVAGERDGAADASRVVELQVGTIGRVGGDVDGRSGRESNRAVASQAGGLLKQERSPGDEKAIGVLDKPGGQTIAGDAESTTAADRGVAGVAGEAAVVEGSLGDGERERSGGTDALTDITGEQASLGVGKAAAALDGERDVLIARERDVAFAVQLIEGDRSPRSTAVEGDLRACIEVERHRAVSA